MRRPWYTYLLLFIGSLGLLGALFRPTLGVAFTDPGGLVVDSQGRLFVRPGSPLWSAGVHTGDRFLESEVIRTPPQAADGEPWLRWGDGIPRPGTVRLLRGTRELSLEVRPVAPAWPVRLAWGLIGLLNAALVTLALALFWQRPRDGRAVLLGLVLLSAPAFWYPREPRLLALALAAHFFTLFPDRSGSGGKWLRRLAVTAIYLALFLFSAVGGGALKRGHVFQAATLFNTAAVGFALYSLVAVLLRWRGADHRARQVAGTATVAAAAILVAVLVAMSQRWWSAGQFLPVNLLPAVLFSAAVGHLVFRLRALEVRVVARRTLQYLLARWTLGTLFLFPGFLLVWRLGQVSVTHQSVKGGEVLVYLLWMFLTALLLGKRQEVLRNLDRRFFRDVEAARQSLIRLAQDLGGRRDAASVLSLLEAGTRQALRPAWVRLALPAGVGVDVEDPSGREAEMRVPIHRGEGVAGYLCLGPKESGEPYSGEERELLEAAAVQAAVALENARLSAALLARQREELAQRTAGVLAGAEEERRRLAADLHDQVLPELRQIGVEVDRLKERANGVAPDLERLGGEIRATMDGVREVMEALRPSSLDMLGLADALESYFRKGAARCSPPLAVTVRRSGEEPSLSPDESLGLYRIGQEAINNVLKHSGASRAGLEVHFYPDRLTLAVWDEGDGMDARAAAGPGHGLRNMRHRAELIGATVRWCRPETGGTRVEVSLP